MPHAVPHAASADPSSGAKSAGISPISSADVVAAIAHVRTELAAYLAKPESDEAATGVRAALLEAASCLSHLPRRASADPSVQSALELIKEISVSGAHDLPATAQQQQFAREHGRAGWPGLLGSMLALPAWQWADAPTLSDVPDWLWSHYSAWLFATPQGFCSIGQADTFARHTLSRLEELHRWVERNPGSSAVRSALAAWANGANSIPLYFSHQSLRRHAELRAKLLSRAFNLPADTYEPVAEPRAGRKLRVGFVNRHFGPQTETYTTLPTFEQMDPERFEVVLFTHRQTGTALEEYCRSRAKEFYVLEGEVAAQVSTLRAAALDVVVFGTNVTAVVNEVTLLALHRLAPLQVVNNSSCITSGLPEIDLYVSGTVTEIPDAQPHFSERLGLLPGPAHAFNYEADREEPSTSWTREVLGIPAGATVFVTAANYFKIIPEMQEAWARLLAATPGSYLLVHPFNPNWSSSYPVQRFCADFDRVLKKHNVAGERLLVSTAKLPSRVDVKELLRVGDVYLDTFPFGGVNSLVDPLELGMPVVVWEGETFRSRMGSALLRSIGVPELIAKDEASYLSLAHRLITDSLYRETISTRIRAAMERQPIFLDALAASDAFGDLVEAAYDEVALLGRAAFRAEATPFLASHVEPAFAPLEGTLEHARHQLRSSPTDAQVRHRVGRAYLERGDHSRAIAYLLSAVQTSDNNAALWFDLATAFQRAGQMQNALQALDTSLQIDGTQLEAWLTMAEWAKAVNSHETAREAAKLARAVAPNDPRIAQYLSD
jgi:protein O-GlcNAc transferase